MEINEIISDLKVQNCPKRFKDDGLLWEIILRCRLTSAINFDSLKCQATLRKFTDN